MTPVLGQPWQDSDWASRGSDEKSENIRSEEKMYLSQVDKDMISDPLINDPTGVAWTCVMI